MHVFWLGVLAGMAVAVVAPGWLKAITAGVAVLLSGLLVNLPTHGHDHFHAKVSPWLIAVGGVGFGLWAWHYARKRGLLHLGQSELNTRWERVREESKWGL